MKRAIRSTRPGLVWTGVVLLSLIAAARSTIAADYMNFGGDNTTAGTFAGLGATNPQPLVKAPPLGPPGGP